MSASVDATNAGNTSELSDADRLGGALERFQRVIGLTPEQQAFMESGAEPRLSISFGRLHRATNILLVQVRSHHHFLVNGGIHPGTNPGQLAAEMEGQTREWERMREEVEAAMNNPQQPSVIVINPSETFDPRNISRRIGNQTF
ncbi:type III effector [Herbaspirillum sp. DW155]|uniref:hypothetical protein n=1 Tax=Herbaspirillum sp. DW155 TaxID=3095609 RepID=UPI00309239BD|nr:type III effector [Herbaspirillum sp. DW155]